MGSRGGRGGRFGGGRFKMSAKQEPFVLFPEIKLPDIDKEKFKKLKELVYVKNQLQRKLKEMPYFLEETLVEKRETVDIERYSDMAKNRSGTDRVSLENSGYMILKPGYFPLELVQGANRRVRRKVQWNPKKDLKKLDILEELEGKTKDGDKKGKDGEEEEEFEEELEEEDDDEDNGDYDAIDDNGENEDDYNEVEVDDDEGLL